MSRERRARALEQFAEKNLDAFLVTSLHNVRYLSGFTGSNGALLLFPSGEAVLFTDPRYTLQAGEQTDCKIKIAKGPMTGIIGKFLFRRRPLKLGIEGDHMTVTRMQTLSKTLPAVTEIVPMSGVIEKLRMVKDADEIAIIRKAVIANAQALENALRRWKPSMSEAEFASEIDHQNRKLGAEAPAFDTIVAAGARAALPHAHPGLTPTAGGLILIDMGAFHDGYASDMTRMVYAGTPPARYKKVYKAVLEAELAGIAAVRAGVTAASVDKTVRAVLTKHGLEEKFTHSTGHGLGLEIHEPPRLGKKDKTKLAPGMAITIEPGVYIEGWGGIRIEDVVLVTEKGCEVLTPLSKELRTL